ncbi:MAG TPA: hypothetical protein VK428_04305 [Acidimicrobiales bacterium]|nr:hypothetical protein [Acidimicrobiales bacterium]
MIDALERELLRFSALEAWGEAKRLHREAAALISASRNTVLAAEQLQREATGLVRASEVLRARSAEGRCSPVVGELPPQADLPRQTFDPALLQTLVDHTIRRWDPTEEQKAEANGKAVGLVASIDFPTLLRLQQLAGTRLGYVVGAHDAGAALGLLIAMQPDLSIIDTRLEVADGSDLAAVLPFYAPRTKTLLLTDDHDLAAKAQHTGAAVMSRNFSDRALLAWVSKAAA